MKAPGGDVFEEAIRLPSGVALYGSLDCAMGWVYAPSKREYHADHRAAAAAVAEAAGGTRVLSYGVNPPITPVSSDPQGYYSVTLPANGQAILGVNYLAGGYNQTDPRYVIDPYGRYLPAENRFPSAANDQGFKPLADYIHAKGLKFGIHIMRGVPKMAVERKLPIKGTAGITADQIFSPDGQCEWLQDNYTIVSTQPGAQEYYNSIFDLYAEWGVDFVKVDDIARPYHEEEIELIRHAIDQTGRPIVLSLSPGATPLDKAEHVAAHANMWRMVDDVWDTWPHLRHLMDVAPTWYPYISTGAWPDCDMIPLGRISIRGERGPDRRSRLTPDEQISLMTLFTISKSPLFFGGDLPSNDSLTLTLMTNPAVLEMHRAAGQVKTIIRDDRQLVITARHPTDRTAYLAIFNLLDAGSELNISIPFSGLNLPDSCRVTELWSNLELGYLQDSIQTRLLPHASKLFRLTR